MLRNSLHSFLPKNALQQFCVRDKLPIFALNITKNDMKAPSVKHWQSVKYLIMAMETVADREPNK